MTIKVDPPTLDEMAVSLWMSDLLPASAALTAGALATGVRVIEADTPCLLVDELFRADERLSCLAVRGHRQEPRASRPHQKPASQLDQQLGRDLGLLTRDRFQHLMAGRLGYGRILNASKPVATLTDWSPLVVSASTPIADLARLVLDREPGQRDAGNRDTSGSDASGPDTSRWDRRDRGSGERGTSARVNTVLVDDPGAELREIQVSDVFRALSAELASKALTDSLTGLGNRERFMQHLQRCVVHPDPQRRLVVVYIDLDGFKAFNDGHGHGVGDRVLQIVADRLTGCIGALDHAPSTHRATGDRTGDRGFVRAGDLVARLGGDEFAVITHLPVHLSTGKSLADAAAQLGERIRACLGATLCVDDLILPGRASIGMAVASTLSPHLPADGELLLREADLAMYRAKTAGGHRVEVVTNVGTTALHDNPPPDRRELQSAIDHDQFRVYYQPIVEVGTGRLASVEALVRWQHPQRGLLAPGAFLDAVADAGFSPNLDLHVLRTALAQFSQWQHTLGPDAPPAININVSVDGLLHPDLLTAVLDTLREHDLAPGILRVELPESATLAHLDTAANTLEDLRRAGVRLTLDDLGAGASTLHHLTGLALDGVKIDRRFVAGLLEDERDAAVVRMLLELAHNTHLAVTAEGVETHEQVRALRDMTRGRPTFIQGYLINRPVPAEQVPLPWPQGIHRGPLTSLADSVLPLPATPAIGRTGGASSSAV